MQSNNYSLEDLLYMMRRLRDPQDGCPWDLEQSPKTIVNYSIEEVYELAEVIEREELDYAEYKDELGDVLLQVVFLSQFAAEEGEFEFSDVITHLCKKMIRRHPHVFPNGQLRGSVGLVNPSEASIAKQDDSGEASKVKSISSREVNEQWDKIKRKENSGKRNKSMFDSVPLQLPALVRAQKIQKKATKIGLDWTSAEGALRKVMEECVELQEQLPLLQGSSDSLHAEDSASDDSALSSSRSSVVDAAVDEELGDILFSVVNVVRKLGRNPEQVLRAATKKFIQRAEFVDAKLRESQLRDDLSLENNEITPQQADEIDEYWRAAKKAGL